MWGSKNTSQKINSLNNYETKNKKNLAEVKNNKSANVPIKLFSHPIPQDFEGLSALKNLNKKISYL